MEKGGYVYIVSCPDKSFLGIGVTDDLPGRVRAHKEGEYFLDNCKQPCSKLLYYEYYEDISDAGLRAEQLKKWSRSRQDELLWFNNPGFEDLSGRVLGE